jgi:hypothetical protein
VIRGGGWNNTPKNVRTANRNRNTPDNRNNNLGFRLILPAQQGAALLNRTESGPSLIGSGGEQEGSWLEAGSCTRCEGLRPVQQDRPLGLPAQSGTILICS